MVIAAPPSASDRRTRWLAVGGLTVTQIIGWGTTFHVPAVLSTRIADGTGLRPDLVFGGLTLMLVVAAFVAPRAGRLLEGYGAGPCMVGGSLTCMTGLLILATAHGPLAFVAAWLVIGIAMPFALNQGSSTALVQISPSTARRDLAALLMLSGFSTTVSWPSLLWLDGHLGWRGTLMVCAGLNLLVCAPLHALLLPRRRRQPGRAPITRAPGAALLGTAAQTPIRGAFALAAMSFSIIGMLTWGIPLHMISLLRDFGHSETEAVILGALFAPAQVLSRGFEILGGKRLPIMMLGVIATSLMPVALIVFLGSGRWVAGAAAFSVLYGISAGLSSIVRAVAPLRLFGQEHYAMMLGRLSLPTNAAFAIAPIGFSTIREHFGGPALVAVALTLALICVPPTAILFSRARTDEPG